ncbi:protein MLN51 homolog [Bidens hawaiensis]|uniref:protein MLN51 homolog n=1 Tax=Bidens hawaiensis TaxID=980011 RepID=UPI00404B6D52
MADLGEKEEDEYDSDPEQAKLSLTMRRRMEASDEEEEDDDDDDDVVSDARVRVRVSDYESDGQGAAAEYDDDDDDDEEEEEEELELVEDEEDEGVIETVVIRSVDRFDDDDNNNRSGGVEEGEGEGRVEEKKENEPFAVPTAGAFYMHDDRFRDGGCGRGRGRNRRTFGGRKLWELRDERKWGHDKFEEVTTQDRRYHEHRRVFRGRNRGRGRNIGEGRGFSRNYNNDNNNNNNQTTGPKSVRGRGPRRYQPSTQNTFLQPPAQSRQHAKPMERTSHASSGRATAASATSASESAHGFVRKNVVASSLNFASLPFYPSGSSNKESKSGSVTRGPRPPTMSENYPVSQSNISQGRNVSVSLGMDKLYIDDSIPKPMNSQTRAHGRGPVPFGQVGHQSVPFSQQFRARSASVSQAFSPPKTSGSTRGLEYVDMESSTESNDFKAVLGLRGKGSTLSSGTGSFSYGDQNFSGAPRFLPVMQFAGQHPRGLGVPAVGMAFPGYVGQPDGLGNSEMTWLPVLAGAAGALGAAGLNAPYHPYITMDGAYNARPSGQLASLAHPINKDSNMNKSSSEVKPYPKPEIEKDELRQRQNKARRYTEMKFDK